MTTKGIESDLGFVQDLLYKSDHRSSPVIIYLIWAVIVAVGFALFDFARPAVGWYWAVASPFGGILSGILGARHHHRLGQRNRALGIRHALHWGGLAVAVLMAVLLALRGNLSGEDLGKVILLLVAYGWWSGGVHFDRVFMWLGGVMGLGFLAVIWIDRYAWTCLGILVAAALVTKALTGQRGPYAHES
jgi:hypothetical protein